MASICFPVSQGKGGASFVGPDRAGLRPVGRARHGK